MPEKLKFTIEERIISGLIGGILGASLGILTALLFY